MVRWRNGNAAVCKTATSRFDSGPHLHGTKTPKPRIIFQIFCKRSWANWTASGFLLRRMRVRVLPSAPFFAVGPS